MASPAAASLAPFAQASPPRRRAHAPHRVLGGTAQLPTSSSEGALAVSPSHSLAPAPAGQSAKIKPFILRSTTSPINSRERAQSPPAGPGLSRAASVPAFNSKPKPAAGAAVPPLPSKSTKIRRSDRPTFIPSDIPTSSLKPSGRANNKPSRWSTAEDPQRARRSSIILAPQTKLQTVEQRKTEMKRASVLARRQAEGGGGTPSSVEKGKRWLANLAGAGSTDKEGRSPAAALQQARRKASLGDMTNGRRAIPSPPAIESSSPSDDLYSSSASSATIMPHGHSLRAPTKRRSVNDLRTPPRQTSASPLRAPGGSTERLRKDRYAALSRSKSAERPSTTARGDQAYSSMQEMLEHSGFADVRVITPTSTLRVAPPTSTAIPIPGLALPTAPQPHPLAEHSTSVTSSVAFSDSNAFGSPSSLAPPLSLAHKTSMLSLRGLFSLWKADAAVVGDVAVAPQGDDVEELLDEDGSEAGSDDTITLERKRRFVAHTQQWVDQVSREVATLSASPATLLHQSANPSSAAYPPRPDTPRKSSAPSPATVNEQSALRESTDRRRSKQALRTLRHVVSDSDLASSTPEHPSMTASGYQSFALGGLALGGLAGFPGAGGEEESSRREYDDVSSSSEDEGGPHHQRQRSRQQQRRPIQAPPPPGFDPNSFGIPPSSTPSFWGALRTRASEALLGSSSMPSQLQAADDSVDWDLEQVVRTRKSEGQLKKWRKGRKSEGAGSRA